MSVRRAKVLLLLCGRLTLGTLWGGRVVSISDFIDWSADGLGCAGNAASCSWGATRACFPWDIRSRLAFGLDDTSSG